MPTPMLIRIRPEETRVSHSIRLSSGRIQKFERGKWYEVADPELIRICAETRSTFGNPNSSLLFDVKNKAEAAAVHREEIAAKAPPPATPEAPVVVTTGAEEPLPAGDDGGDEKKAEGDAKASSSEPTKGKGSAKGR